VNLSLLSRLPVPSLLASALAFLPPAAALWTGRPLHRDPAGRVALAWLFMALAGVTQLVVYMVAPRAPVPVTLVVTGVFPVLLLPPTLAWIGGRARRVQWPVLGVWLALYVAVCLRMGHLQQSREFKLLADPVMSAGMAVASAWALAAQVRRAPDQIGRADWFWILVAHVLYFAVMMFRMPLIEAAVARNWAAAIDVHNGVMLLHCAVYVLLARGMLLRRAADDGRPTGQARTFTTRVA
jgi:hypothetical protein